MMERSRVVLALVLAMFAAGCAAPSNDAPREAVGKPEIDNEPADPARTVAGLTLGRPARIDECSKEQKYGSVRYQEEPEQLPCWILGIFDQRSMSVSVARGLPPNGSFDVRVPTEHVPEGVQTQVFVTTIDGNVERLSLYTHRQILSLLVEKWGEPTTSTFQVDENRRRFDVPHAEWILEAMSVSYHYGFEVSGGDMPGSLSVASAVHDAQHESTRPKHADSL